MASTAHETYEEAVLDAVSTGLRERLSGSDPRSLGSPGDVAERMLATVPLPHPWDTQIGPFYDTPGVVRLLGISKQAVADRVRRCTLLAVSTAQGRVLYPVWQFDGRRVDAPVSRTLAAFRHASVDGWALASWFTTPAASLDGATPLEWLHDDRDPAPVDALALDTAQRWAR